MLERKISGIVVSAGDTAEYANVIPLGTIDTFLKNNLSFQLPLAPESQELMDAAYSGDEKRFYKLLESIGDPNTTDAYGSVALERVATTYNNFFKFLELTQLTDANGNIPDSACHIWTKTRVRMAKSLLAAGANVDGPVGASWTPLMSAVTADSQCDNTAMVEVLLDKGAEPNHLVTNRLSRSTSVRSPLMMAVEAGPVATVKSLLAHGANASLAANAWSGDDLTPLFALAVDPDPTLDRSGLLISSNQGCWSTDNANTEKFRLLLPHTKLSSVLGPRDDYRTRDYVGMTVRGVLEKRLGGGCNFSTCDGQGRAGEDRCLERLLGALLGVAP